MTHTDPSSFRRSALRTATLAAALPLALSVLACEKSSDAAKAVDSTSIRIDAMADAVSDAGGPHLLSESAHDKEFTSLEQDLSAAAGTGRPAEESVLKLLIAEAQAAQAENRAQAALSATTRIYQASSHIRDTLASWTDLTAQAEAISAPQIRETFDNAQSSIQSQLADIRVERAALSSDLEDLQAQVQDLRDQIAELEHTTVSHREQEASLREEAVDATSERQRTDLIERAVDARRQADRAEVRMGHLLADIASLTPRIESTKTQLGRLDDEQAVLNAASGELANQQQLRQNQLSAVRTLISEKESALATQIEALHSAHTNATQAYNAATSAYTKALSSARSAKQGLPPSARDQRNRIDLTTALINQDRGDLLAAHARQLGAFVETAQLVSDSIPSHASALSADITDATDAMSTAQTESAQAYADAASTFRSLGSEGDTLSKVAAALSERAPASDTSNQ